MKFRIAISRKVLLGVAGALLVLGGGAGGAVYMGYVSLPFGESLGLRGSVDETPPAHGEQTTEAKPAEGGHAPAAEGDHAAAPAEGEQAAAAGEHGAAGGEHGGGGEAGAAALPAVTYEIPPRSDFNSKVRDLMKAQSAAATGAVGPVTSQREAISKIQIALQTFDPKTAHQEELESLGIYLLSGGNPRGLAGMIEEVPSVSPIKKILRGAHDYVTGDTEKAKALLMDVDLSTLSQGLAARLSLAQAAMIDPKDFAGQAVALKRAAGYAPGTLVEEAAYRRLVALAMKSEDQRAFVHSSRRYIRRFPNSLYIGEFLQNYGQGLLMFEEMQKPLPRADLDRLLHILPHETARTLVLELGKQTVKRGLRDLCLHVTRQDYVQYLSDETDVRRQRLYGLACNVVEDPEAAKVGLTSLEEQGLPPEDTALKADALRLAEAMLGETQAPQIGQSAGPELPDADTSATEVSAAQQLQASEELLKEALQ
ncbi:hypothetical protein [Aestuariivirga sp.]|uniref:hypothetical protein n=1 Tax=Aestuariivirga sp. TaxID=2650926 RepID=UPI0039E226B3